MAGNELYRADRGPDSCDEVGFRRGGLDRVVGERFRRAYEQAGGEPRLGCPREDDPSGFVGPWGPGLRQDLRGGSEGEARIMAVGSDDEGYGEAVVMSGKWYRDYTDGSRLGGNSGPVLGYPVTAPRAVGRGLVVRLKGGEAGAGLMVSGPDETMFWIRGVAARRWLELSGPDGPLGLPVSWPENRDAGAYEQRFEHGTILVAPDGDVATGLTSEAARPSALGDEVRQLLAELNRELPGALEDPFTIRGWGEIRMRLREAEQEIERGRYADAATDLGSALQLALRRAGYTRGQLGDQLRAARKDGLFAGLNTRLGSAAEAVVEWISAFRNQRSDAHPSEQEPTRAEVLLALRLTTGITGWLADREGPER